MKHYQTPLLEEINVYADKDMAAIEMAKSEIVVEDDTYED